MKEKGGGEGVRSWKRQEVEEKVGEREKGR